MKIIFQKKIRPPFSHRIKMLNSIVEDLLNENIQLKLIREKYSKLFFIEKIQEKEFILVIIEVI